QPKWLEMTFSGEIQEVGSEVTVVVDGKDVSAGELTVEGKKLEVALPDDLKPGDYEVTWRVVSQDGHPISGDYAFTIKDSEGAGGDVKESSEESTKAGLGGGVVDEPGKDTEERGEIGETAGSDSGLSTPLLVLLPVGGVAIVVVVVLLMLRQSPGLQGTKGDDSEPGPKSGCPAGGFCAPRPTRPSPCSSGPGSIHFRGPNCVHGTKRSRRSSSGPGSP